MGVARSNSPNTVSHRIIKEAKDNLDDHEVSNGVDKVPSEKEEEYQVKVQRLEIAQEEDVASRSHLKAKLKSLLSKHNGCTKNKEVVGIITKLSKQNPHPVDCAQLHWFPGDYYTLTAPSFPGRIKAKNCDEQDLIQYTLGRLSFNIFQPNELICTVRSIRNPVHSQPTGSESKDSDAAVFSYHFIVDLTIHTPDGDLEATLMNRGFCRESKDRNNRMLVTFTGGTLIPGNESTANDDSMLPLWEKTFAKAYERAKKRTIVIRMGISLLPQVVSWTHIAKGF